MRYAEKPLQMQKKSSDGDKTKPDPLPEDSKFSV